MSKHYHCIGICGVAMSAIAGMLKELGHTVTGSDKGFFPPVSDVLRKKQIPFYPGWHPEKMGTPDVVVVGNYIGLTNPEYVHAKKQKWHVQSFPEIVREYVIKKNAITVVGTYGKTTLAAFLTHVLIQDGKNPSYLIGGIANNLTDNARSTKSDWSVVEGDEYSSCRWDQRPKFLHYPTRYAILTGAEWDHMDLYPTETAYLNAFNDFLYLLPTEGMLVIHQEGKNISKLLAHTPPGTHISYGTHSGCTYRYQEIDTQDEKTVFQILKNDSILGSCITPLIGAHMLQNLTGGIALCSELHIPFRTIQHAVATFTGVKRRLEIRGVIDGITIIDDLAHSPSKARASLAAIRRHFPLARICMVYEPNVGSRTVQSIPLYQDAFVDADEILFPRFSSTKMTEASSVRLCAHELAEQVQSYYPNARAIEDDQSLVTFLKKNTKKGDVIAFLGSHGFRGMIEEIISPRLPRLPLTSLPA